MTTVRKLAQTLAILAVPLSCSAPRAAEGEVAGVPLPANRAETRESLGPVSITGGGALEPIRALDAASLAGLGSFYELPPVELLGGGRLDLAGLEGKVLVVVNVPSQSELAGQLEGLEALREDFAAKGVEVLAFPSNDFGGLEPGRLAQVRERYASRWPYPVSVPVQVRMGAGQSPHLRWLASRAGTLPSSNFCKYVVGRDGRVRRFLGPIDNPAGINLRTAVAEAVQRAPLR